MASLLVNKTNLFSQPPVSLSCFTSCQSVTLYSCVAVISVCRYMLSVVGGHLKGYHACCLPSFFFFFLCPHFILWVISTLCACAFYWFHPLTNRVFKNCVCCVSKDLSLFASSVRLSASPSFLRLSAWLDVLCLSPLAGVQRTAGTSYKAWCRTSPLNPPHPPLYRDRLAPGKVRHPSSNTPCTKPQTILLQIFILDLPHGLLWLRRYISNLDTVISA